MSCPTCDHTMHGLGELWFWCPRCGTTLSELDREHTISIPHGVERARNWLHNPGSPSHLRITLEQNFLRPDERSDQARYKS